MRQFLPWIITTLLLATCLGSGQESASDPGEVLVRVRERLLEDLERLPRYTCVQTITRQYYRPRTESASCSSIIAEHQQRKDKLGVSGWDRLRLEVAIVDGKNVFSWVGEPRFDSSTLDQLGGRGPLGSGDFGPFLHSVLSRGLITFKSEQPTDNRRLLVYSYEMPVRYSQYMVRTGKGWTATAYNGEFVIDPKAEDIASLTVRTAELPASNSDCQGISEVDYGRTEIHDRKVLIPRQTRLTTIGRNGSESQNLTEYTKCREYAATFRILSDDAPALEMAPSSPPQAPSAAPAQFPGGYHFRARIVTPIDSDTAAAGDPVEVVLKTPIRDKKNVELAPVGAHLRARLINMEERSGFYFRLSLQFESIEVKGVAVPLRARADRSLANGGSVYTAPVFVAPGVTSEDITNLTFAKQHLHLDELDWGWTTLAARSERAETTH